MAKKLETDESPIQEHRARDISNDICVICSVPMPCLFVKKEHDKPVPDSD
jgi:hypothetical protein